jgi:SAM-dependent methyltransferase
MPTDPSKVVAGLFQSMWGLTALGVASERGLLARLSSPCTVEELAGRGLQPKTVQALLDVLQGLELVEAREGRFALVPGLASQLEGEAGILFSADLRSTLGQFQSLLRSAGVPGEPLEGWRSEDPVLVRAQAVVSEAMSVRMTPFLQRLEGCPERLQRAGAAILDVGAGGAGFCIAMARHFPQARIVGLEPASEALAVGHERVKEAGLESRIELRPHALAQLGERDAFDLAYAALMFMPDEIVVDGLPRLLRSLRPGGWLVTATVSVPGPDLGSAVSRFRAALWGDGARSSDWLLRQLTQAGFVDVRTPPGPPGSTMTPIAARRPPG